MSLTTRRSAGAVAHWLPAMIHTLSDSAQFVTTTFRSEMLAQADKFYGVYFDRQKVSTIATIERDEAYEFVENAANGGL